MSRQECILVENVNGKVFDKETIQRVDLDTPGLFLPHRRRNVGWMPSISLKHLVAFEAVSCINMKTVQSDWNVLQIRDRVAPIDGTYSGGIWDVHGTLQQGIKVMCTVV